MDVEYRDVSIRRAGDNASLPHKTIGITSPPSSRSMLRARAQALARAPSRAPSFRRGRLRDTTLTRTRAGHGYVRTADGTITTFDAPGAGTSPGQGTFPLLVTSTRRGRLRDGTI